MKKLVISAVVFVGLAIAAIAAPSYEIKIVEKSASACGPSGRGC